MFTQVKNIVEVGDVCMVCVYTRCRKLTITDASSCAYGEYSQTHTDKQVHRESEKEPRTCVYSACITLLHKTKNNPDYSSSHAGRPHDLETSCPHSGLVLVLPCMNGLHVAMLVHGMHV